MKTFNIEISRTKTNTNKNFVYKIVTDDNNVIGELANGETKSFQLTEQTKYIKAKLMWCSSKQIDISTLDKNSSYILTQNNFLNTLLPLLGGLFPLTFAISIYNETLKYLSSFILVSLLILLIGTLTFWRDRWLLLKKKPSSQH